MPGASTAAQHLAAVPRAEIGTAAEVIAEDSVAAAEASAEEGAEATRAEAEVAAVVEAEVADRCWNE
jgi:hypothetical protein